MSFAHEISYGNGLCEIIRFRNSSAPSRRIIFQRNISSFWLRMRLFSRNENIETGKRTTVSESFEKSKRLAICHYILEGWNGPIFSNDSTSMFFCMWKSIIDLYSVWTWLLSKRVLNDLAYNSCAMLLSNDFLRLFNDLRREETKSHLWS